MNKADYIRRSAGLQRVRRFEWQRRLWEYVEAHPCVDCNERDPLVLEFDHVKSRNEGLHVVLCGNTGLRADNRLAELATCEVRYANCHRRRTAAQFDCRSSRWLRG
jgi:hypothetical protein